MNDEPDDRDWDYRPEDLDDDPSSVPVDPGDPTAEGVAFVLLGAILTLLALARLVGLV